ncbi:hypothetical protein BD779DRAFT_968323 [Infundibulicybe gibba]|nr:hypothetical protein BD779DRAFT_968323 [Infundibulicybe gibba]
MVAGNVSSLDSTPHLEKKSGPDTQKPPKTPLNQRQSSASHSHHDQQPKPKAGSTKSVICPVCMGSPLHARYECPVILAGADALEKRIFELRKGKNIAGIVESTAQLTDELRAMVNKIRGPTTAANASSPKQPAIPKIQPIPRPLSSSSSSSSSESEESEPLPTATSVGAGNEEVSGIDLESLIRGPIARVSDLVSPESSEEELNDNSHLEEDSDEGAKRPKGKNFGRKKTARHVTDSSDEGEDEQAGDQDTRPNDNVIGSGENHFRIGSTSFQAVDILGESVSMDQSGNDAASDALAEDAAIHNLEKDSSGVSPKPQTQVTTDQQGQAIENITLPQNPPHSANARKPPWGMDIEDPIEPADDPKLPQCSPIEADSHPHVAPLDVTCDLPQTHPIASPNQGNEVAVDRGNTSLSKCISEDNDLADADVVKTPISSPKSLPPRARMRQGKHTSQPLVIPSSTKNPRGIKK